MRVLEPGDHLDQYLLVDVLARTAMGTTFKGHDTATGRPVCVKVPRLEVESDVVLHERLLREERIGLRVNHRNVVHALQPRERSRLYLVTEFVPGRSLRSLIDTRAFSQAESLDIARQLAEALAYLHVQGVIHRDLKPENIIVTPDGDVKVIDFGIARDRGSRRLTWTKLSNVVGTPDYMSPEQIGGRRGDERSDVYSVGVILYEMLTGHLPFSGDPWAVMRAKTREEPLPPAYFVPQLDPGLDAIVCKAISRDARQRHRSASELLADLIAGRCRNPGDEGPRLPNHPWMARVAAIAAVAVLFGLVWLSRAAPPDAPASADPGPRQVLSGGEPR